MHGNRHVQISQGDAKDNTFHRPYPEKFKASKNQEILTKNQEILIKTIVTMYVNLTLLTLLLK